MSTSIAFPDVHVQIIGEDGNVFSIIARVTKALKTSGYRQDAEAFAHSAMDCSSYNEVLQLTRQTVDVS